MIDCPYMVSITTWTSNRIKILEEILKKISSYNIFNFLLPGTVFAYAGDVFTSFSLIQKDLFVGAFLYYFFGLVISRFGSVVIEKVLIKWRVITFSNYEDYVVAERKDSLLPVLSEVNNTLRTMCSLLIFVPGIIVYDKLASSYPVFSLVAPYVLLVFLFVLFLFAYRKQTNYITNRVQANKTNNN